MTAPALPGDWSDLVVIVGAVPWDGPRMLDQHLARGLTRYGPVLYVDAPTPWRPGRSRHAPQPANAPNREDGLRLVAPGLAVVTPRVPPGHQRPGMKAASLALVRRSMRLAVRSLGSPSVLAVFAMSLDRCFGACGESKKVFYASDDFTAAAELMRISARRLERDMRRQPREADLVVAASPSLATTFEDQGYETLLVPNGCDFDLFSRTDELDPALDVRVGAPVAGLMGHLSERIDARYLEAIAARGHSLLLVGPAARGGLGPDLAALARRSNVDWVGPRDFEQLPSYLRLIDVGLIPYADTPFNHASFPLKALEYLAAGRPVLSTDIDAMRWLRGGAQHRGPIRRPPVDQRRRHRARRHASRVRRRRRAPPCRRSGRGRRSTSPHLRPSAQLGSAIRGPRACARTDDPADQTTAAL